MFWIGLTGSIGSGKSTVAELLQARGIPVIDADHLAREAVQPGTPGEASVLKTFGQVVTDANGHLDRKKMAAIVFSDPKKLKLLESLIHPLVQANMKKQKEDLRQAGHRLAFYDVPLLFEKKLETQFDGLVVVFAELEICISRVMARSHLSREDVTSRIKNQLAIEEKIKKSHWVVNNNGSKQELVREVEKLLQDIGRKFDITS